ncbi:MAG: UbiX family flavin prenyltransferase [Nitrospinae bacterium]|nr:UbiX family flavin prenyltransferase [Nitrospinota bacterium]
MTTSNTLIAITGASGIIYAKGLVDVLCNQLNTPPDIIFSDVAEKLLHDELNINKDYFTNLNCTVFSNDDFYTPPASGSASYESMVIIPATLCTVGKIANGIADNLITRAADVFLKEKRNLIVVPRETPLNVIHLENLLTLSKMNVSIIPASPGFYHKPQSINDLIDFMVDRILSHLKIDFRLIKPWQQ